MRLLFGGLSPFVRKVMIVAHETGAISRIETDPSPLTPFDPSEKVISVNPVGKIPALVLESGEPLYGATPICEYLDEEYGNSQFFPRDGRRWSALRRNAAGDGLLEAGNLARIETLRPEGTRWQKWRDAQLLKVRNVLDTLEHEAGSLERRTLTIGEVAIASALGWLDIRLEEAAWRDGRPALTEWFSTISERESLIKTAPVLPK